MRDEPDIIKEMREAEKHGLLQNSIQSAYEEFEYLDKSLDKTSSQTDHMLEDRGERIKEDVMENLKKNFQTIFENYAIAITVADNKERIVSWNKYTEELLNMTQNELYLKSVSSLYPPEEWKKIRAENIRKKGIKYSVETRIIRKNQGFLDVDLSLCILRGKEGKTIGSIGIIKDITRLKKTEKKLKASEERYRTIFENSAVAITFTDENERIISWNKFTEELLDMNGDDLFMKPVESLYPTEEWEKIRKKNIRQKGMQYHLETKILRKNNEPIDVNLSLSVLKNHEGRVIGSIGVIEDINERKQIEKALVASEKKFKQLYENAPLSYHTLSPDGVITDVNQKWCEIFGYSKREVIGKPIFDFITREESEAARSSFMRKIQNKKSYTGGHERTYITKNGKEKTFVIHDFLSFDNDQKIVSIQTIMEDVTKRKKAEEALRKSEEKFRDFFENANDLIQSVDINGNFVYVNKKWLKTLGYSKNELKKLKLTDVLRKDQISHYLKIFKKVCKGKAFENVETVFVSKKGEEIYVKGNINSWFQEGEFIATRGIFRDITDSKQTEELLQKSEEKFRMIADQNLMGIAILQDDVVKYVNQAASNMIEQSIKEILNWKPKEFSKTIHPEDRQFVIEQAQKKQKGDFKDVVTRYSFRIITKNQDVKWLDHHSKTIIYDGKPADLTTLIDITDLKKAENELKEKIDELERFQRVTVGRELKMVELKKQNEKLEKKVKKLEVIVNESRNYKRVRNVGL